MAMAGQAQLDRLGTTGLVQPRVAGWRQAAKTAYYLLLLPAGAALVVLFPPNFDFRPATLLAVGLVGLFLVLNERPQGGFKGFHVPLTAIQTAAVASIGAWALPLSIASWTAVHLRLLKSGRPFPTFVSALAGQLGMTTFVIYAMLGVYAGARILMQAVPVISPLTMLFGILAVGMVGQTVNNALVCAGLAILGEPESLGRYWRSGLVASLWAYLLTGMYAFGGILGPILFYYVVAETRMFERITQAAAARDERDLVANQFHQMIREFIGLLSPEDSAFAGDVRYLSMQLAKKLALPKADIENIGWAAEFHEIGKCKLSAEVRNGTNLTPGQEYERLRYPMLGAQVLRMASKLIPDDVARTVEHQCEAFDGSGYPTAMHGQNIPLSSRVVAIARDYMRLLTGHAGAQAMPKEEALRTLVARAGTQYDPALVDLLCREIA
jgi:hypothetical protein